jgi:septal ring factor EnvC (AmiA/AmiB activator)
MAQSQKELEAKKKKVDQSIRRMEKDLKDNKARKVTTLKDLNAIQGKIEDHKTEIVKVTSQISNVENKLGEKEELVFQLENEIKDLKNDYAKVMRKAYKASLVTNEWMLVLSAASINQAFVRWQYLRHIKEHRKAQAKEIADKQLVLESELADLQGLKYSNQLLLNKAVNQNAVLNSNLKEKNDILDNLGDNEKHLLANIKQRKVERNNIEKEINRVIRREIERKRKEALALAEKKRKEEEARLARIEAAKKSDITADVHHAIPTKEEETDAKVSTSRKLTAKKSVALEETPESAMLSSSFQGNRGSLNWPVSKGAVVRGFGKQAHPELKHVTINNNGLDIRTEAGADAKAVFDGEVIHVAFIAGYKNTVMVNHGKYYTIYSNLETVYVTKGQKIKTGALIGKVGNNGDMGFTELHFELWNEHNPMNPLIWLKKR